MDTEVRQFVNAALRSYDQARNSAFRRFNAAVSRAMAMEELAGRQYVDDAWRAYITPALEDYDELARRMRAVRPDAE